MFQEKQTRNNTRYTLHLYMVKSFNQSWLEEFFHKTKHKKVPTQLSSRLTRKLNMMNAAKEIKDLNSPPSNHLLQL